MNYTIISSEVSLIGHSFKKINYNNAVRLMAVLF